MTAERYTYRFGEQITEDKALWCKSAPKWEDRFVKDIAPQLNLTAEPNNKEDKYAPDLIVNGGLADLKYSTNPFILSTRYGVKDPRYAHAFNEKDFRRYILLYPDIQIYFWHEFEHKEYVINNESTWIEPMNAVWTVAFPYLAKLINANAFPLHQYRRRTNDLSGNAKASYILNLELKNFNFLGTVN